MRKIVFREESYLIIGACFEVYKEKGCGFIAPAYQECLEMELDMQGIPSIPQKPLALVYKDRLLKQKYQPDFICSDKIILELKAVSE